MASNGSTIDLAEICCLIDEAAAWNGGWLNGSAAGVGITLTKASDMLFVETDLRPAVVIAQLNERAARVHAKEPWAVSEGYWAEAFQNARKARNRAGD